MKIIVDKKTYPSKKAALEELSLAMVCCDGSERDRMVFAYCAITSGYTVIDTYKETMK